MERIVTRSSKATKKIAAQLAKELFRTNRTQALIIALEGELGAGKTTFVQGFSKALGVKENIVSPTFVLIKIYQLFGTHHQPKHIVHIDCYRLDSPEDLLALGFRGLLKDKDAIILIEWAGRVRKLLPGDTLWITFQHGHKTRERRITINS